MLNRFRPVDSGALHGCRLTLGSVNAPVYRVEIVDDLRRPGTGRRVCGFISEADRRIRIHRQVPDCRRFAMLCHEWTHAYLWARADAGDRTVGALRGEFEERVCDLVGTVAESLARQLIEQGAESVLWDTLKLKGAAEMARHRDAAPEPLASRPRPRLRLVV